MIVPQEQKSRKKHKNKKRSQSTQRCLQPPKETRTSTKRHTMTRKTDNNNHFTKHSSTTGTDAPQADTRQTEEPVKGCQTGADASVVAPQSTCSENAANTKNIPRRKTSSRTTEVRPVTTTIRLTKNDRMLYLSSQFKQFETPALLDTGAIQSDLSENQLRRITTAHHSALLDEIPAPKYRIQIANGNIVPVRKQVLLRFFCQDNFSKKTSWYYHRRATFSLECHFSLRYTRFEK